MISLLARPLFVVVLTALVIVAPLLLTGESSATDARARARTEMFSAGTLTAQQAALLIGLEVTKLRDDLERRASGDLRQAVAAHDSREAWLAGLRLAGQAGPQTLLKPSRVAITDSSGDVIAEVFAFAAEAKGGFPGAAAFARHDQRAATLVKEMTTRVEASETDTGSCSCKANTPELIRSQVLVVGGPGSPQLVVGALVWPFDSRPQPQGLLMAEVDLSELTGRIAAQTASARDLYVVDKSGAYLFGSRPQAGPALTDLSRTGVVMTLLKAQPVSTILRDPATLHEDGDDPFTGSARPFSTAIVPSLDLSWHVLVVPSDGAVRAAEDTLSQLFAIRLALAVGLLVGAFALASALGATTRRRRELATANAALAVATRHKSEFLANMSHELRTPLNAVIGFADVLNQRMFGELNPKQTEYVGDISASGHHLLDLVNDILDLSKVEAGRLELELSEFSPADTISGALGLIRERSSRHGIALTSDVPVDLGRVVGDERKIRQVLLNLLSNAVKFTPDGGSIGIRARTAAGHLRVSVSDNGIGIAPEDRSAVFEEFRQVGKSSDRSREGTGLGLTLAKRFVELHGGTIWLDSEVGKGTTFTFAIPDGPSQA